MAWDRLIKHEGVFTLGETNIYLRMGKTKVFGTLLWLASAWIGTRECSDSEDGARTGSQAAWVPIPDLPRSAKGYLPWICTALKQPSFSGGWKVAEAVYAGAERRLVPDTGHFAEGRGQGKVA